MRDRFCPAPAGVLEKGLDDVRGQRKSKKDHTTQGDSIADNELEMIAVIGKIAVALSQSAGHTVEV
jgi:hypothetical protein